MIRWIATKLFLSDLKCLLLMNVKRRGEGRKGMLALVDPTYC